MENIEKELSYEQEKNILNNVSEQISSFDIKASIQVSIIGIIFGFSFSFIEVLDKIKKLEGIEKSVINKYYISFSITYICAIVFAILTIVFSMLVIIPRKHHDERVNINYYNDLKDMSYDEYKENGKSFISSDEQIFKQIKVNSKICAKKHFFLKASILSMIPYAAFMLALIILSIVFLR